MALWGELVTSKKSVQFTPNEEMDCLELKVAVLVKGKRAVLKLQREGHPAICVCALTEQQPNAHLDIFMEEPCEFSLSGEGAEIQIVANYVAAEDGMDAPDMDGEMDEDEEDMDDIDLDGEDDEDGDEDEDGEEEDEDDDEEDDDEEDEEEEEAPKLVVHEEKKPLAKPQTKPQVNGDVKKKPEETKKVEEKKKPEEKKPEVKKPDVKPAAPQKEVQDNKRKAPDSNTVEVGVKKKLPSGVVYEVIQVAKTEIKDKAVKGKKVKVQYSGSLAKNGKTFDKGTLEFRVGAGEMIKGFDEGVNGMLIGERRRIFIPSKHGYGARGAPPQIPPHSDLIFDVRCLAIK